MKKIIFFTALLLIIFAGCKEDLSTISPGQSTGNYINLKEVDRDLDFDAAGDTKDSFTGLQGTRLPLIQDADTGDFVLTAVKNSDDSYSAPTDPIIIDGNYGPNAHYTTPNSYNFGVEYSATFKITDDTRVVVDGTSSANEPQGLILAIVFVGPDGQPRGAMMAMAFISKAFPCDDTWAVPAILKLNPKLDENVLLTQNFDGDHTGHLVAGAKVPSLTPNEYHTMKLKVHNDAEDDGIDMIHGPSVSIFIDDVEVIKYSNAGSSHSVSPGVWDTQNASVKLFGGIPLEGLNIGDLEFTITDDVLGITEGSIPNSPITYSSGTGAGTYNELWKSAIWRSSENDQATNLISYGIQFQIGSKTTAAGTGGSGAPGSSKLKSPFVKNVTIRKTED